MPMKVCEVCGANFMARLTRIRTCSTQCRNQLISSERQQRHRQLKQCAVCSKEFEVGASGAKRQTCSAACGRKLAASKTSQKVRMECVTCGKSMMLSPSKVKHGEGRYCSRKCMYERNADATERACLCCGKLFRSPPSQMHVKTCSTACRYEWFSGPRAYNYVGATRREKRPDGTVVTVMSRWYASKKDAARRAATRRATPAWADEDAIRRVYDMAARLEAETGVRYHVDHIVPLRSKRVCGLHNEFNLCALPALENIRKGNRHWPDMP